MMATFSPDPSLGSYLNRDDQDTVTVTAREDPSGAGRAQPAEASSVRGRHTRRLSLTIGQVQMNILVTGGTGTLGRHVVRLLRNAGHRARILSRNPRGHVDAVQGNLATGAGL